MTAPAVYDPAMRCSAGICGKDVDRRLVDLAASFDWLKAQGVNVGRFGLSRAPAELAASKTIRQIMQESDGDDLPVFLVNGRLFARAHYPCRAGLERWAGIALEVAAQTAPATRDCYGYGGHASPIIVSDIRTVGEMASSGGC